MKSKISARALVAILLAAGCGEMGPDQRVLAIVSGSSQSGTVAQILAQPFVVSVRGSDGAVLAGVTVQWSVTSGGGTIAGSSVTGADGNASATLTLGQTAGQQTVTAALSGANGSPQTFTVTAAPDAPTHLAIVSGDLQLGPGGQALAQPFFAAAQDQFGNGVSGVTVDWVVTAGAGSLSAASTVTDATGSASVTYTMGNSTGPQTITATAAGLATPTVTFTASLIQVPALLKSLSVNANYGIHDMYVRDGIAFLCVWNSGLLIYDVGDGRLGGTPADPKLIGSVVTSDNGVAGGPAVHNAWWFHNQSSGPNAGEKRYVFVGQEGPATIPSSTTGDIHVVDVSNMAAPVEVAFYHMDGAGTHNFWVDEQAQILYAAYYNGGVVALDVSGTLTGDLATREIDRFRPATTTFVWGVQLFNGSVYVSDFLNGLFQLKLQGGSFVNAAGGPNVADRYTSDLWVHGSYAYTGTWGNVVNGRGGNYGDALKIWALGAVGAPTLVDSIITPDIHTVSDVEVSTDGKLLLFSAENGAGAGIYLYGLTDPAHPDIRARVLVGAGVHTATLADIAGKRYVFAAKNPGSGQTPTPALQIYEVTSVTP